MRRIAASTTAFAALSLPADAQKADVKVDAPSMAVVQCLLQNCEDVMPQPPNKFPAFAAFFGCKYVIHELQICKKGLVLQICTNL